MKKSSSANNPSPAHRLTGWKRWAFPLVAMTLIPALFFVLLEGVLRLVGFGYPTSFLIERKVGDKVVYTDNRHYGWRFFPKQVARRPADIALPAQKEPNTFRVFVLGESAAMGDPENAFGLPRILEVMLAERYPDTKFEVVNAAMTGISSHIIQDIAMQCAQYQPDCFVIYMGNNEAIGPYGPGTVFASFSRNLALTRLSIQARSLKMSQLLDGLIRAGAKSEEPEAWGGLRVFMKSQLHPSDERVAVLTDHFEANLQTICEAGRKAGAKLVLCTIASSLADCSPFGSMNAPSLSGGQKTSWEAQMQRAAKLHADGKLDQALKAYEEAEVIDPAFAELHYQKGKIFSALKRPADAHQSYQRARDYDALRFRTASDLNERVKKVAETFPSSDAALADVVAAIEQDSRETGVGSRHFVDHVHFNFHGNYMAAREICEAVSRFVPASSGAPTAKPILSEQECAERLAFSRWNELRIAEYMLKRYLIPPFDSKSDGAERANEFRNRIARLKTEAGANPLEEALALYQKALERKKTDPDFLRSLAELHGELGQPAEEIKYRQALVDLFPYDDDRKAFLAEVYSRTGKYREAGEIARSVLQRDGEHVVARLALATALQGEGSLDAAIKEYREVLRMRPDLTEVRQRLEGMLSGGGPVPVYQGGGLATSSTASPQEARKMFKTGDTFIQQGRVQEGMQAYRTAVQMDPSLAEAHLALAGLLVEQGKVEEAIAQCKEGLRGRPDFIELHNNVGALLTDLGRYSEARPHLEAAVRLNPRHDDARLNLALNLMHDKRPAEALVHFETFIKNHGNEADIHLQMGILYENTGRWKNAADSYRQALRIKPEHPQYQGYLAWLLATAPADEVRNGNEALTLAQAALNKSSDSKAYLMDTLAAAFAEAGQFEDAIKTARNALELARTGSDRQIIEDITKRISLYQDEKPFRSSVEEQSAGVSAQ